MLATDVMTIEVEFSWGEKKQTENDPSGFHDPFRAPKSIPVLPLSNFGPQKGFQLVVKALTQNRGNAILVLRYLCLGHGDCSPGCTFVFPFLYQNRFLGARYIGAPHQVMSLGKLWMHLFTVAWVVCASRGRWWYLRRTGGRRAHDIS